MTAYFQAADIVSQVLNFGLPAAIDAQISGNNLQADYDIALRLQERMARDSGRQRTCASPSRWTTPAFKVNVDRAKALAARHNAAAGRLEPAHLALAAPRLLQPNFWLDPVTGVNYNVIDAGAAASDRLGRRRSSNIAARARPMIDGHGDRT